LFFLQALGKACRGLDWETRVSFKDLVCIMMDPDLVLTGLESPGEGARIIETHHGNWHRWDSHVVTMD
jgi:GDPmannose 4,6-dehydratase